MPLNKFICKDGETVAIEECIQKCRLSETLPLGCCPINIRKLAAEERVWAGKPSVTQLLNGTLQSYLKIMEPYNIDPTERIVALKGTAIHTIVEQDNDRLEYNEITGLPDWYDDNWLVDFKNWKMYKTTRPDFYLDTTRQLNMYRIMLKNKDNIDRRMVIGMFPTDSSLMKGQENFYWIEVEKIEDKEMLDFFLKKKNKLLELVSNKQLPEKCTEEETWGGRKCKFYCDVRRICYYGYK